MFGTQTGVETDSALIGGIVHDRPFYEKKAEQLERDFGVPHPFALLEGGLRRVDKRDIEPHTISVARDRLAELQTRGLTGDESLIVLLMRGARIEVLARAISHEVEVLRTRLPKVLRAQGTLEPLIAESQRGLNLYRRA